MLLKTTGCSPLLLFTPPSLVPTTAFPSLTFLPGFPVLSPQPPVPLPHCPFASASVSSILASSLPSAEMPEDPLTHVPDSPHMRRSSPAVHNGGASLRGLVQPLPQHLPEGQHGVCGVGDAMVWPSHVMELSHRQRFLLLHLEGGWVGEGESWAGASVGTLWSPGRVTEGSASGGAQRHRTGVRGGMDRQDGAGQLRTHVLEHQISDCPVLQHLLTLQRHLEVPMCAGLGVKRPVMFTLHLGANWEVRVREAPDNPSAARLHWGTCIRCLVRR